MMFRQMIRQLFQQQIQHQIQQLIQWIQNRLHAVLISTTLVVSLSVPSLAHSAPKTILVLGDSLSAEYGITRGSGWVALLEKRLSEKKLGFKVFNASVSGETSSGGKSRLNALLQEHRPQIVIIELGGNDALRGLDLKASESNFREMVKSALTSKSKVLLVGMKIPPNYGKTYGDQFFNLYAKIAKENNIPLVPFLLEGVAEQSELFQADRIHMKAEAHPRILENVWSKLEKMLK